MEIKKIKTITYMALFLACLCLMRAFAVQAAESDAEEVYEATHNDDEGNGDDAQSSGQHGERPDVRLSRPEEAAARRAKEDDDPEFAMVDGADRLHGLPAGAIGVPVVRSIASAGGSGSGRQGEDPGLIIPKRSPASAPTGARATEEPKRLTSHLQERIEAPSPIPVREDYAQTLRDADGLKNSNARRSRPETVNGAGRTIATERVRGLQEVSIIASDLGFFPSRIFVTQGIPVKVYLSTPGKNTLCFMVDGLGVKKGIAPGQVEEVSFVPDTTGDYRFYCPVRALEGKMTVRAPASER